MQGLSTLALIAGIVLAGYGLYAQNGSLVGIGVALVAAVLLLRIVASLLHLLFSAALIGIVAYLIYTYGHIHAWW